MYKRCAKQAAADLSLFWHRVMLCVLPGLMRLRRALCGRRP